MSTTLKPVLQALNLKERDEQVALVQLLQAAGAFGALPVKGIATPEQAAAILDNVTFANNDEALNTLHAMTQHAFLRRPSGVERVHVQEPAFAKEHRAELLPLLTKIGLTSQKSAVTRHFDHALVLGAMELGVEARLDELKAQWERGVRFDKIYLLGSERPLIAEHENSVKNGAHTEMEMFLARYKEKSASWPAEMQAVPVFAINTPNHPDGKRANTKDTIERWLSAGIKPGSVLAVSTQPYANYQDEAVRAALPPSFTLETVGTAVNLDSLRIGNSLDSIAREIDVGYAKIKTRMAEEAARREHLEQITMVDPVSLKADPARFQFRLRGDKQTGVTEHGKQSGPYNPLTVGTFLLWEDKQGERFIVDGHHRAAHIKELRARGEGPAHVPARILRETDGYSALDANIIGACTNFMQDRKVDMLDAAVVFHEAQSGKAHIDLLPRLKLEGNLTLSYQAAQLTDPAFELVKRGEVPVEEAAQVATHVSSDQQLNAMQAIKGAKSWRERVQSEPNTPSLSL